MTRADNEIIESHGAAWLEAAGRRRSRRTYTPRPADDSALDTLEALCQAFRPHRDARVELVRSPVDGVFNGVLGAYGKITGAPHLLVIIGDGQGTYHQQHAGYTGEAVILEATRLGLDTCWVGGFFNPAKVSRMISLSSHERALCVSPVGHAVPGRSGTERAMQGMAGADRRKPLGVIAPGHESWPAWARAAAEAARTAPSAMNRQPWRLSFDGQALTVSRDSRVETPKVTKELDCGIAMLHAEIAACAAGVRGEWQDVSSGLDVARLVPRKDRDEAHEA